MCHINKDNGNTIELQINIDADNEWTIGINVLSIVSLEKLNI